MRQIAVVVTTVVTVAVAVHALSVDACAVPSSGLLSHIDHRCAVWIISLTS